MKDWRQTFTVDGSEYDYYSIRALEKEYPRTAHLPFALKVLLENLMRGAAEGHIDEAEVEAFARHQSGDEQEISFQPARILMQDFTGVPAVADLAAMRDAMEKIGGQPDRINPLVPVDLVIDHSVQVDVAGRRDAAQKNAAVEFQRNQERYTFLRWGQTAFDNLRVVPPDTGIVHQINLEYLAPVVCVRDQEDSKKLAYPDTLIGTDSHTTMINGLGVLGWGVGGIEAEAAMLGQPVSMLIPQVVGFELAGHLPAGVTATDLVLTVTQILRQADVVGKFVEFHGAGLDQLPLADRATIANMAPEYGATCGLFPIDAETIRYLRLSGRDDRQIALVEAYARAQGWWRDAARPPYNYSQALHLDMSTVQPCLAGPKRPQDHLLLSQAKQTCEQSIREMRPAKPAPVSTADGLDDGAIVIAAITSCTNTSNPSVMIGAGLLARKAVERGLSVPSWVKTSLAPGSLVVRNYLDKAGLMPSLEELGFHIVGFGCTTCIGNSGPLPDAVAKTITDNDLVVASVLSGNRNFEGRVHPQVRMNFLASPPLVVAYALAGNMNVDLTTEPLGTDKDNQPVYLRDIWPDQSEIDQTIASCLDTELFRQSYRSLFDGDPGWRELKIPQGNRFQWQDSTYVRCPPFFQNMTSGSDSTIPPVHGARALALLGDSITTDHISPAGAIKADSPAGLWLQEQGVAPVDFNSYGSRRGNHEVMMRGTFANIRLRNRMTPKREGGWTVHVPSGAEQTIYDAAMRYQEEGTPLVIIAGREYGTGSSRDWAAKGTRLLGVKAVIAVSFERIHRSNLVGMGVLPLVFQPEENADTLGLRGDETFDLEELASGAREATVVANRDGKECARFQVAIRIDTPKEWQYYLSGGILPYMLKRLAA